MLAQTLKPACESNPIWFIVFCRGVLLAILSACMPVQASALYGPATTRCKYPQAGPARQSQIAVRSAAREAMLRMRLPHPCKLIDAIHGIKRSYQGNTNAAV